ncbi:N-acetylmuramoyl-L-alanine amidase [Nocardia blacklockiae]|uniref:N-acetylmuramoyl-L-alanine amidase n=1 Tax=Nocardia blacklockiae TaxID=480036 RepID=UPI0018960DDB|nr:N-acetylmuramoyl-L-alanine amidase [Nocardia blacklockiae]MBF6173487.1 N-acetylmuramoyl-L-alanine amidase [Nocardia blacklockiae]
MPYRRPKRPYILPVVATLAVTAPLAGLVLRHTPDYHSANESNLAAIPAQLAEVGLASAPDVVLPLRELTGLDLPDLRLSDLRKLPLPRALPVPPGLPTPPGVQLPSEIPLPQFNSPQATSAAPTPGKRPSGGPAFIGAPLDESGDAAPALAPGTDPDAPALAPGAVAPELADQVGAEVKELTRETPFSMVALTAENLGGTKALVRARTPDGSWGPWFATEQVDTRADDHAPPGKTGTEPIYVGRTNAVQVLTTRKAAPIPGAVPARSGDPAQVTAAALSAVLIDPGRGVADGNLTSVAAPLASGGPKVISRAQWGADESIRCEEPTYDDGLGGITVHHTAGRNDYSQAESAGIVRAIYAYHAKTLGWCDIGYHALVDKYGQIFEGHAGGLDRPVQGAHAGGFNENTSGVALMGDFETEPPTDAAIQAAGQFIGWRAKVAGLNPQSRTTMYSEGTEFTPYAQGEAVQLPTVFAHRDVGNTTCPGDAAYALMDRIREIAAGSGGALGTRVGNNTAPGAQRPQTDLAALADLTGRVLGMVGDNIVAKYWADQGGPDGRLGAAASEPQPTANGGQYAKFVNGYVYAAPDGTVVEVVGHILDRFVQLGAETGLLGLPLRNAYPVPDGLRADFQHGSLILNQVTGIVTTLLKTYGDGYPQGQNPVPGRPAPVAGQPGAPGQPAPATPAVPEQPASEQAATPEPGTEPVPATGPEPDPVVPDVSDSSGQAVQE